MTDWLVAKPAPMSAGARKVERIEWTIPERPLLHACCANDHFGDVNVDIRPEVHPDVVCDIRQYRSVPYPDGSFGACFMDYDWRASWKRHIGAAMRELLRLAPVVYTLGPYTYGSKELKTPTVWWCWRPGVNEPLLFVRYQKKPRREATNSTIGGTAAAEEGL